MSLFTSIQIANNSLHASQIGLQVAGNNIANANTPGYIRQRAQLGSGPTQVQGKLLLGTGVRVDGIAQQIDYFLEERLRGANSDLAASTTRENVYLQLEAVLGELSETDLSSSLTRFFSSINDILNQPESEALRNLAVLEGQTLATDIQRLDERTRELRSNVNQEIVDTAGNINRLLTDIAELNGQISLTEASSVGESTAVGLRDQRQLALTELSTLIDIRVVEQPDGSTTVFSNGDYLVLGRTHRDIVVQNSTDRGITVANLAIQETDAPLTTSSGKLAGLVSARDDVLGGFIDKLDDFTRDFIFEFNKVYSGGQGLEGFTELTSERSVSASNVALDQTGLEFTPENGSFQIQVRDAASGLITTTDIFVNLNGLDGDTTLDDLVSSISAIDGITADITPRNELRIRSDDATIEYSFAADTSGVLAALGVNTFFSGHSAANVNINNVVRNDLRKFAASQSGPGADVGNAVVLAGFYNAPLESTGGASISDLYEKIASSTTQEAAVARAVADGSRVFQSSLEAQSAAISAVNLDEETIDLITFQRSYQASARFVSIVSELLETLINL